MRKIKFRGHDRRGNTFYGAYNADMGVIDDWEYAATHAVDKAEQLVYVDKNGKEIYTGDLVVDDGGEEFIAVLVPMMIDIKGKHYRITDEVVLKEKENGRDPDQNTCRRLVRADS